MSSRVIAACMAVAGLLHTATLRAADEVPRYTLKEDGPRTGTNIRRDVVRNSPLPLDRPYAQLTPQEQAIVKSQYETMGPEDEPPFPAHGLRPLYKAIASAQQRLRVQGPLVVFVDVDSEGRAVSVSVVQSPDPRMTQAAATILMLETYKPARCGGVACRMQFPLRTQLETSL